MKIHLIRSSEVPNELFSNVVTILRQFDGVMEFVTERIESYFDISDINEEFFDPHKFKVQDILEFKVKSSLNFSIDPDFRPEYPEKIKKITWNTIFDKCREHRIKNSIPETEPIIMLTSIANENNWFSGYDPSGSKHFFVHTAQWEYFLSCDPRFPVAYETIAVVFRQFLFKSFSEINTHVHFKPRGCVNDFCKEKKEITFKMRTADMCHECNVLMRERGLDQRIATQFFQTIDHIRSQMLFRERFKTTQRPSRMEILGSQKKIIFTDLGDAELKLSPLEKVVYLLFLNHPDGLHLNEIYLHREWMEALYNQVGNPRSLPELRNSMNQLTNPTENSVSEKISRIRSKIVNLLGPELAPLYYIEGPRSEKKTILINREMVVER